MFRSNPLRRTAGLALALALLSACFDPPVRETLRLRFLPDGSVAVTSAVEIGRVDEGNPVLQRRIAETRQALLDSTDPWSRRFAALDAAVERFSWEKRLGEMHKAERTALLAAPADLRGFFADTSLSVSYRIADGVAELAIAPSAPGRATRRQRKEMERTLEEWSGHVAEYLAAAGELYRHLDGNPERARACLGAVFEDVLSEADRKSLEPLSPAETRLVKRVEEAMVRIWDVLIVADGQEASLDEISHLVYDPFPARLSVKLPGRPLEVEGFETGGQEGLLQVASPGLWNALLALEGRWLSPDPAVAYVLHGGPSAEEPLDLEAFLAESRRADPTPPVDLEVRRAIEERLRTEPLYRATWKVEEGAEPGPDWADGEDEEKETGWPGSI